ncbi:hypothetical protein U9M73_04730 [Paenibacillus phoenicis]|uniref:Uncharacterized protein n=1 Tax=Paenibacillus phoenicis TaxID=554117 RepID=A0ABU5PHQ8_9BACL|nr:MULTISPECIES: hypothetical protein [Paenibacillus]EES75084.1 hypothetical protein POTG_00315 [Paenibacillus sp. oral taxon 786 str. D14]MEA3569299.1 hypothetical protein [Paenibacillus phoenicis]
MSFGEPWFYIVLLGAAALVYALLLPGRQAAAPKAEMARELEATLEQYMAEIENENQELIDMVAKMKQDLTSKQLAQQEQIAELRQRLGDAEAYAKQTEARLELVENAMKEKAVRDASSEPEETPQVIQPQLEAAAAAESDHLSAEQTPLPDGPVPPQQELVRDRYPELFELYDKGKSIDMIAKSTGFQRGEVQLILQLAKKEESR